MLQYKRISAISLVSETIGVSNPDRGIANMCPPNIHITFENDDLLFENATLKNGTSYISASSTVYYSLCYTHLE